ncbi:MAG: hypothetical protein JXA94_03120 [Parachlamydiales bacterium]|nr:hypothetical protein [Parachlamydiales bacterium]
MVIVDMAIDFPAYGQLRELNELKKQGKLVSAGGVISIWFNNDLNNFKKRLDTLKAKMAQENGIYREAPLQPLKKEKQKHICLKLTVFFKGFIK